MNKLVHKSFTARIITQMALGSSHRVVVAIGSGNTAFEALLDVTEKAKENREKYSLAPPLKYSIRTEFYRVYEDGVQIPDEEVFPRNFPRGEFCLVLFPRPTSVVALVPKDSFIENPLGPNSNEMEMDFMIKVDKNLRIDFSDTLISGQHYTLPEGSFVLSQKTWRDASNEKVYYKK
jgi:hypothetical protein